MSILLTTGGHALLSTGGLPGLPAARQAGTLAVTEGADTAAFAGGVVITGALAVTEAADTADLAGTAGGSVTLQGPVSSLTYRGVTINLSTALRYHVSANGDPVFITESAGSITSITPASTNSSGTWANGAEKNVGSNIPSPWAQDTARQSPYGQGLEEIAASGGNVGTYYYNSALNVDPGATGSAIAFSQGDAFTITKALRETGAGAGTIQPIGRYVHFGFMGTIPGAGTWFRPGATNPTKAWSHRVEDLDFTVLQSRAPTSGMPTVATALADFSGDLHSPYIWGPTGEGGRRMVLPEEDDYTGNHAAARALQVLALHRNDSTTQDRTDLAIHLVQRGIDVLSARERGMLGVIGAGQGYGYQPYAYLAGFMLGDQDLLNTALTLRANTTNQCYWVSQPFINYPVNWDPSSDGGNFKRVGETYRSELLGMPEWTKSGWTSTSSPPLNPEANASLYATYRETNFTNGLLETMASAMLQNGPGGQDGAEALAGATSSGAADYTTANIRAAAVSYMDRSAQWDKISAHGSGGHDATSMAVYDGWRQHVSQPLWTGKSDTNSTHDHDLFSTGTSGAINYDLTNGTPFATETVTGREVGYSQDSIQFITKSVGTGLTGSISSLRPGTQHWCRYRQTSASGTSYWSQTWEQCLSTGDPDASAYWPDRGLATSGGTTPTTSATNTVTPVIHYKPANHSMPYFEPVTDATDVVEFWAGIGYWTGGSGNPVSASYQWKRNGADIATGQSYKRQAADSGTTLTVAVTVNSVTAPSTGVAIPSVPTPAAGVVIDIDFSGSSPYDWPTFWGNMEADDSGDAAIQLIHHPTAQVTTTASPGCLQVKKLSSHPHLTAQIASSLANGTYNWEAEFGGGFFPVNSADTGLIAPYSFALENGSGTQRGDAGMSVNSRPTLTTGSGTFTISGGDTSLRLHIWMATGTGGSGNAGGGPVIARLKVWLP